MEGPPIDDHKNRPVNCMKAYFVAVQDVRSFLSSYMQRLAAVLADVDRSYSGTAEDNQHVAESVVLLRRRAAAIDAGKGQQ